MYPALLLNKGIKPYIPPELGYSVLYPLFLRHKKVVPHITPEYYIAHKNNARTI